MRMNGPAIRSLGWTWTAALATFALGVVGLAAAVVVPSQLPAGPDVATLCGPLPTMLPVGAGLVALLAAALALLSGPLALARPDEPEFADAAPPPRDLVAELAAVLDEGRENMERTRTTFEATLDGTVRTGARLTVAALDAERRLGTLVNRAQDSTVAPGSGQQVDGAAIEIMRHAAETTRRASEHLEKVEQSLPGLLGTFAHAAAAADSGISSAVERLAATAFVLEQGVTTFAALPQVVGRVAQTSEEPAQDRIDFAQMQQGLVQISKDVSALSDVTGRVEAVATGLEQISQELTQTRIGLASLPEMAEQIEDAAAGLVQVSGTLARSGEALAALPATAERIEAATTGLVQASDTLARSGEAVATLPATAGRIEAAAAGLAQASENFAYSGAVLSALPDAAGRIEAATSALAQLSDALMRSGGALTTLPATAERIEAAAGGLAEVSDKFGTIHQQVDTATRDLTHIQEELSAHVARATPTSAPAAELTQTLAAILPIPEQLRTATERLDEATQRAEAQAGTGVVQLKAAIAQAESAAAGLAATLAPLAEFPTTADRLHLAAERIESGAAAAEQYLGETSRQIGTLRSAAEAVDASTSQLDRAATRAEAHAREFEAALGHTREALETLQAAIETAPPGSTVAPRAPSARGSVAAALLADLPESDQPADLTSALNRMGGVETEVGRLLREAEDLAERAMTRKSPALPSALARRAPDLLESIDQTVRRLQSVSTALALACDGGR